MIRRLLPWLIFLLLTILFVILQASNDSRPAPLPGIEDLSLAEAQARPAQQLSREAEEMPPRQDATPPLESPSTVVVRTESGGILTGRLLIARAIEGPLEMEIGQAPTPIPAEELDVDSLRALKASNFLVVPVAGGMVRGTGLQLSEPVPGSLALTVKVPDGFPVKLQLTDHHQAPVVGAKIVTFDRFPLPGAEFLTSLETDEDGIAEFTAYDADEKIRVRIMARGYGMETIDVQAGQADRVIELDRMFGLGLVLDRRFKIESSSSGMRGPLVMAGYRNEDWKILVGGLEEAIALGPTEYLDWTINREAGSWREPDRIIISFRGKDGSYASMEAWMRAFVDPEFTVYHIPPEISDTLPKLVPFRFHFSPERSFAAGYPESLQVTFVPDGDPAYAEPEGGWMFGDEPPASRCFHVGGGEFECGLEPGSYRILQSTLDFSPGDRHPRLAPNQVINVGLDGGVGILELAEDEAFIGLRVVDPDGFLLDGSFLLIPQEVQHPSFFSSPNGGIERRFIHPGEWSLWTTTGEFQIDSPIMIADGIQWPQATIGADGFLTIHVPPIDALSGEHLFY